MGNKELRERYNAGFYDESRNYAIIERGRWKKINVG